MSQRFFVGYGGLLFYRFHPLLLLQDAICTLNTLQTNASALEQVRRGRSHPQLQLQAMKSFLERVGLTVSLFYQLEYTGRLVTYQ